jgi:molybdopterin-guanine dinucleotide biosynthesis protein A
MKASCYGLVLAGGLSSRMGRDKAKLRRAEQTMLDYSQSLFEPLNMEVFISGGEQGLPDLFPQLGPLAGIYTIINHCKSAHVDIDALLIVPVDMPLLTTPLLRKLMSAGMASSSAACYQESYFPLYLPVTNTLYEYLSRVFLEQAGVNGSNQSRSIKKMLATIGVVSLPLEDVQALVNVNTPEEWDRVKGLLT